MSILDALSNVWKEMLLAFIFVSKLFIAEYEIKKLEERVKKLEDDK